MIKSSLLQARAAFEGFCNTNNIINEKIITDPDMLAYFVPDTKHAEAIQRRLTEYGRKTALQYKVAKLPTGKLHVLAAGTLPNTAMVDLVEDATISCDKFRSKLAEILKPIGEMDLRYSNNRPKQNKTDNPSPAKPKVGIKSIDDKINEALEGIATPDDVQPQEGLKSLFAAIKQSGLGQALKKGGVSWHVAEPGKHAVTFSKGDTPILQLTSIELGDAKKLGEVLSQLTSIAQGKAPQAAQLELDRVKEMASRASDRKSAMDDIAQQFAIPKPEEQQQVNILDPRAAQPAQPGRAKV